MHGLQPIASAELSFDVAHKDVDVSISRCFWTFGSWIIMRLRRLCVVSVSQREYQALR